MEPIKRLEALKKKLDKNSADREILILERDMVISEARKDGKTWREIALVLGMTEHGVIKAANRNRGD